MAHAGGCAITPCVVLAEYTGGHCRLALRVAWSDAGLSWMNSALSAGRGLTLGHVTLFFAHATAGCNLFVPTLSHEGRIRRKQSSLQKAIGQVSH